MSAIFRRHPQRIPDYGVLPPPCTWDKPTYSAPGTPLQFDLALVTCPRQHTGRITARIHHIGPDGTVYPSYVCPRCAFHAFIRLLGWTP